MARLRAGILGKVSGKVANVVAGNWRGINYVRERVTPANPRSANQTAVRESFALLVLLGRATMSQYIRTYWDKLASGKPFTGWSKFIGTNQKTIAGTTSWENIKFSTGDLEQLKSLNISAKEADRKVACNWSKNCVSNGAVTDSVIVNVYSEKNEFLYSQDSAVTRDDEIVVVSISDITLGDILFVYADCYNANGKYTTTIGTKVTVI
ncbi:MAG: DUF6266 family protein [Candidatus Cloacimonadota bacterium]|nr:DUF6266 family protein [Candidatus Cloacimonadota bacterium]